MFLSEPRETDITFGAPGNNATMAEVLKDLNRSALEGLDRVNSPENDFDATRKDREDFIIGVRAAYRQNRLVNFTSSQNAAMAEATDYRIAIVREQTGVVLENPFRDGYFADASRRVDEEGGAGNLQDNRYASIIAQQRRIFDERMGEVLSSHPDKARALDFGQSIEDQARAIAISADYDGENHQGGFLASLVGGLGAAARDPLQVAALFATGGESVAGTAIARIGWNALRQGLLNAGISAIEQPAVQEWRRDAGLRNGVVPSLENVGLNFAFGAIIGGGVHGGVEFYRADRAALQRVMDGTGTPADVEAAARSLGATIDPETKAALGMAEQDIGHAAIARADAPEGLPAGAGDEIARQAIRHAQDPANEPPPPVASPPVTAPDTAAAARVMDEAVTPLDGVAALRGDPALVEGALHSGDPALQQAGRLAALSDEAFGLVQSGRAAPEHGVVVGELSPDPSMDAPVLARLAQAAPETPAEARLVAADAIEGEARRRAAISDTNPPPPVLPRTPRGRAAADPETWSLFEMLAREGGLKPDPELAAIFGTARGPFVPSFGPLVRPAGRDLDDALRLAKERGYMFDAADVSGAEGSLIPRDLLDRLDAESRGQRQYKLDRIPIERDTADRDAHQIIAQLHDDIALTSGDNAFQIDKAIEDRVVQIMTKEGGTDVLSAYERAIMEDADRFEAVAAARVQNTKVSEIDGWDIPFDGGPAPRDGGDPSPGGGTAGRADAGAGGANGAQPRGAGGGDRAPGDPPVAIDMPDGSRRDVMDLVPMMREDGTMILSTPEAVGMMADHQEGLANLIKGCRL
ncbi:hypothetical protein [Tardiphaga sp.]|jgi:hypothetical protein|uniref:hypothetical protein n=1 Tax=Tardiphaga sp. TaxID=1926292 RepID=UPI0037D9B130